MTGLARELVALLEEARAIPGAAEALVAAARRELRRIKAGRRSYKKTHWGNKGGDPVRELRVADVSGPVTMLGTLELVEYFTDKRGDGPSVYYHDFSDEKPILAYDRRGLLVVAGGTYEVTERGIVG